MAIICTTASAATTPATPRSLISVHAARDATWHWQRASGHCCTPYYWGADRASTTNAERWGYATRWWDRATAAHASFVATLRARATSSAVPAWFTARMPCLARAEEYGPPGDPKGGQNTTAGYFGMVSPPYAYPGGSTAASWLSVPYAAQVVIVYAEWQRYGASPWPNTAPGCGL